MANGQNNGDAYMVANAAMARLEAHEELCGWRYQQIVANQNLAAQDRVTMHTDLGSRIDRLYGRAWLVAIAIIGLLGGGLLYFVKAYLDRHP